jgi:hypothetical protein
MWPRFTEVRSWPESGAPFANTGHAGSGTRAVVRVSPDARDAYAHLVRDSALPEGAVVAMFHADEAGHPGAVYVMQKGAHGWEFLTLTADGIEPISQQSGLATEPCGRCHAEGVADSLFGTPTKTPASR